jgi:DNA polymerase
VTSLSIDFETRATFDLRAGGVYPYAMHKDTGIWCFAWAFDGEEPAIWTPGMALPERIIDHIEAGGEMRAWNAAFERIVWRYVLPRYFDEGWFIQPKMEQWVCSAAEAAAMSLPRSLDQAAAVTGVAEQKDKSGYELMMRMTRPRKIVVERENGRIVHEEITWWDVQDRKDRLFEYCKQDVRTEQAIVKVLRRLTPREREIYLLTERMNDRGIRVDRPLVLAAKEVADEGIQRANGVLREITGGAVTEVTKTGQLKKWLGEQGVPNHSVAKAAVRELLESDLSPEVRKVIELRADAGRSSLAKLDSILECLCEDDYIRGLLLYHGAGTGRWTGRLFQPHNLPKPTIKRAESFIDAVLRHAYDEIDLFHNPIEVIMALLRPMLTASPGCRLLRADYATIEVRVLSVLAGQDDDVQRFLRGEDVYKAMATALYNIQLADVNGDQRQTGKFAVLGCGYGMGAKKAVSAAKTMYQLDLSDDEAKRIVTLYRTTHDKVVDFWNESNSAAIEAVEKPGVPVVFGALRNLTFLCAGSYLYLILPAKRPLVYPAPRIVERNTPWGGTAPGVEFSGVNPVTRQWDRSTLYGGLIVENIVQAVSRDLMADAKLALEAAGYPVNLSVHDEIVADVPLGFGSIEEFKRIIETPRAWAQGWPIKAEPVEGPRYGK